MEETKPAFKPEPAETKIEDFYDDNSQVIFKDAPTFQDLT
jgi:hypothetical protein